MSNKLFGRRPTRLPVLHKPWAKYLAGLRVVGYWALVYAAAIVVVLLDCVVWRP